MPIVGQSIQKLDAVDKVTGAAKYVDDISIEGMWYGAVARTKVPHGIVKKIRFSDLFDWSKVVVATNKDIPGKNCVPMIESDVPLIIGIGEVTKHIGEAAVLVAAPTREQALIAVSHILVECEELPAALTIDDALQAKVKVRGKDNVVSKYQIKKGSLKKGFAEADEIIEGTYEVGYQEHIYIENQGMVATYRADGGFDVTGSLQCPYYISKALSVTMNVPEEKIAVRQATVGGAFGGKEDYPSILAGYACVLSKKSKHPVKIIYDRPEDTEVSTKRHPARIFHKTGVKKDGTLTAQQVLVEMDAGAYATMSPVVLARGLIHSSGPYKCANVQLDGIAYATNKATSGAFRGFGAPQVCFAVETHIDRVAKAIGISPLAIRTKNVLKKGDKTATGQVLDESAAGVEVLNDAKKRSEFEKKWKTLRAKKNSGRADKICGVGMSLFYHGGAFTGGGEARIKGKVGLRLDSDGKITVLSASTDMGQGAHTVIPQMAADHLGLDISCVGIEVPDTSLVPNTGPTVASRTTMINGAVLLKCAKKLKATLIEFAAKKTSKKISKISMSGKNFYFENKKFDSISNIVKAFVKVNGSISIVEQFDLPPHIKWSDETFEGDAYPTFSWGCDVAEVEIDPYTFEVCVKKLYLVQEMGKAVNPQLVEGQIEGGSIQSLGYALLEKHVLKDGRFTTNRLQTYIIPTFLDTPEMETVIVEKPYKHLPLGVKGIGEMPMNGAAPAIVNAIANAIGADVFSLPISPEEICEMVWKKRKEEMARKL